MTDQTKDKELYRLIYAIDGAPCLVQLVPRGARLAGLFRPSMPHCTFDGWGEVPARMPANDLVLDGHFTKEIFRVVFAAGVEQYGVADLPAGVSLKAPPAPSREGCRFVEWDGFTGVMPGENRVFEAQFEPLTYTVTYVVDEIYRFRVSCAFGAPIPRIAEPKRENYVFSGWSDIPETMPAEDITIVGHFEEKRFKLTRVVDGHVFSEEYLPFGAAIDKRIKPVQDGYYFSGWRKLPDTMPACDIEVVASMYPARFRAEFFINDKLYHAAYVPFGEPIPTKAVPEIRGMLFGGWDNLPATMPAHDIAVRASMTAILYRLSFEIDGEEIDRRDVAEGEPIPTDIEVPSRPGHAFLGWRHMPAEMPAHDLTLVGVYAAVKAHYVFMIDGEVYRELTPEPNEKFVLPRPGKKDGKSFGGWEGPELDPRTGVSTYYGSYRTSATHNITYMMDGEVIGTQELRTGTRPTPPEVEVGDAYEFIGWQGLPTRMPGHDIVVEAEIKRLKYSLEFVIDDEVIYETALDAGQEIACPAPAAREGYTFGGWENVPPAMPEEDLIIQGSYRTRTHTVTYRMEGESIYTAVVHYGDALVPPDVPEGTDEGHFFVGWSPEVETMPDRDIVIEGAYSDTVCLMQIYVDGVPAEVIRARVGEPPRLPQYPEREGMRFVWQDAPSVVPQGRLDVHGGYVRNTYKVTYMFGEMVVGEERYIYGAALSPSVTPPDNGTGAFLGWSDLPETMPASDVTVHASFAERTYHITFRLDGRIFAEMDVPVGAPTPNPTVPERDGYCFDGWRNYVSVMPPYNFTAYGTYSRRTYHITYLVGDEVVEEQDYVRGAPIVAPLPPEREHFTFRAWEGLGTHMPAHDLTVSARYSGETYRISYVIDGALVHTDELEFGESIEPLTPPQREGVAFSGWKHLPMFMPAREVIVTGKFEKSIYTVTYKVGGMIFRIDHYEAGSSITPPTPPERPHETFVRWRNLAAVMPDYDFTCVAEYSEVVSHYSFVLDGVILGEGQARKGETITPPEVPHRSGFAFSGWEGFTGVMPTEDVVYIGAYTADKFKICYYLDDTLYCESAFNEGERIIPADAPEIEGYDFSGWKGLPGVMPSDDVTVHGTMKPRAYRLIYRTDGRDIVYDAEVLCGTPLGKIKAPEKFGYEFSGWSDEPAVMPPQPLTINGVYRFTENRYSHLALPNEGLVDPMASVTKAPPKEPHSLVFLAGDYLRVLVDGICYPVPLPTDKVCLRNGRVVDEAGLVHALRRLWHKYRLPKRVEIIMADTHMPDMMVDVTEEKPLPVSLASLWQDADQYGKADCHAVALSKSGDVTRTLVSRTSRENNEALTRVFKKCGATVTKIRTLTGALAEYLQFNRRMERKHNQMCFFYLPNGVTAVLMLDGQVASVVRNRYPYVGRDWDVVGETEYMVHRLMTEAKRSHTITPISMIAVGGIDRTHARTAEKMIARFVRATVERAIEETGPTLFGGLKRLRRPNVVRLGFGYTENRTK